MRVDGSATPPASEAPSRTPSPQPSPVSGGHPSPAASISTGPADTDSLSAEPGYCYVEFSDEMVAEEARLCLALVAQVGNVSAEFSPAEVLAAICVSTGLATDEFTVKPSHLEPFLVCCRSQAARDRLLASSPVPLASTVLAPAMDAAGTRQSEDPTAEGNTGAGRHPTTRLQPRHRE